jgi:DNA-binding protein HU-beta
MNKRDLVQRLSEEHELTGRFAREFVDSVLDMVSGALQKGEEVSLFGFGTFKVAERAAGTGRNPQTGEAVKIATSKSVRFKPASSLKSSPTRSAERKRATERLVAPMLLG